MLRVFLVFTMKRIALKSDSVAARYVFTTIFAQKCVTAPETSWYRNTGEIDNHKTHNKEIVTMQS